MSKFYTNVKQLGKFILLRGVKNGKKFQQKIEYQPTLYTTANKETGFKTLFDKPLLPNKFDGIYEAKDFVKKYKDVENFHIFGNENYDTQFLNETFPGIIEYDKDFILTHTIDIETEVEHGGFPDYKNPVEKIQLISIMNKTNKRITTFGIVDYDTEDENVTYIKCSSETDLLLKYLAFNENDYPNVFTGWNIGGFDFPYTVERIRRVLGDDAVNRLSPFGKVSTREKEFQGQTSLIVEIVGIAIVDYLELYKKFTYEKREEYKLDFIAEVELGKNKLENNYSTFKDFYTNDPELFVSYNIMDVRLVDELEDKLKLIELAYSIAYMAKINFDQVFSPVRMWDNIIYNHLMEQGVIVPMKESYGDSDGSIEGAYVKPPLVGKHSWIASFDLASLD